MSPPAGFFSSSALSASRFFDGEKARFSKIEETLSFYRDNLSKDYGQLRQQARTTYRLWLTCVALGFAVLLLAVGLVIHGKFAAAGLIAVGDVIVCYTQRLFQQREDHYRALASRKKEHLDYGDQWILVIQTIDATPDPEEKNKQQARLVDVLLDSLREHGRRSSPRSEGATRT